MQVDLVWRKRERGIETVLRGGVALVLEQRERRAAERLGPKLGIECHDRRVIREIVLAFDDRQRAPDRLLDLRSAAEQHVRTIPEPRRDGAEVP